MLKKALAGLYRRNALTRILLSLPRILYHGYWRYGLTDEEFVQATYQKAFGTPLNLKKPQTLNQKIQWLKLYDRRPINTIVADKFAAREFIASRVGPELLVPLLFHTTDVSLLTPEAFPDTSFIVKATHGSGGNRIVRDRLGVDWVSLRRECSEWLRRNHYRATREWQYKNIVPRVIVERLLVDSSGRIPDDYKFQCFHGRVEFIYVSVDREHANKRNIYGRNWSPLPFTWAEGGKNLNDIRGPEVPRPENLDEMIAIAETLSRGFAYIRVDLYSSDGRIYCGELTLHHGGGLSRFEPPSWDLHWGKLLDLSKVADSDQGI